MACISLPTAAVVGSAISGIGGLFTAQQAKDAAKKAAGIESTGALDAAKEQAEGITKGGDTTARGLLLGSQTAAQGYTDAMTGATKQFGKTTNALSPYMKTGAVGARLAANLLGGPGSDPAKMQKTLASTPGYQFALQQGLKSTQSSFAAKGLGTSGASLRGAADYTTGLAAQTYGMIFNQAMSAAQTGEAAATTYGTLNNDFMTLISGLRTGRSTVLGQGQSAAKAAIGGAQTGAAATLAAGKLGSANALAAGEIGSANAVTAGLNSLFSSFSSAATLAGTGTGWFGKPENQLTNPNPTGL